MKPEGLRLRPTGLWIVFGPILGCMWLAAVNYTNNLVYAILYLVGSLSFISIFHTWRNLAAVEVEHVRVNPAFAGEDIRVEIFLRVTGKQMVYGLGFARLEEEASLPRRSIFKQLYRRIRNPTAEVTWSSRRPVPLEVRGGGPVRINAGDSCSVEAIFPAKQRGMYRFETLLVRSAYPFGLFWAGYMMPVAINYYVYPQPKGTVDWPALHPSGEDGSPHSNRPGDDFSGVRAYMPGESLRHVDWKAYARGRPLSVKQFTGGEGLELWLDAGQMARMPLEAKLSQLALWIVNAEQEEIPYALRLGRVSLPLGLGPTQARRALEALAVAGVGSEERGA